MMDLEPLLPAWAILLAAGAALVAAARAYRAGAAVLLRLGALSVLVLMLLNPVRVAEQPGHRRPMVAVVVDSSMSMATD